MKENFSIDRKIAIMVYLLLVKAFKYVLDNKCNTLIPTRQFDSSNEFPTLFVGVRLLLNVAYIVS